MLHAPQNTNLSMNAAPLLPPERPQLRAALGTRTLVLVGMMGSGKSSVGRRLAMRLGLNFVDADVEIETAARMTIPEIFEQRGEAEFRQGERRVISRILDSRTPLVLATGGGAFMHPETRQRVQERGISIWLKADPDVLMKRVRRNARRPLLQTADPEGTLRALLAQREPVYALADLTVRSREVPHDAVVDDIFTALESHLGLTGRPE